MRNSKTLPIRKTLYFLRGFRERLRTCLWTTKSRSMRSMHLTTPKVTSLIRKWKTQELDPVLLKTQEALWWTNSGICSLLKIKEAQTQASLRPKIFTQRSRKNLAALVNSSSPQINSSLRWRGLKHLNTPLSRKVSMTNTERVWDSQTTLITTCPLGTSNIEMMICRQKSNIRRTKICRPRRRGSPFIISGCKTNGMRSWTGRSLLNREELGLRSQGLVQGSEDHKKLCDQYPSFLNEISLNIVNLS